MSSQSIYLLRHGERLDYVDLLWQRKLKDCPSDDPPLAPKGRVQAEESATRLKEANLDIIVTSPFQRCVETASIVATVVQKPILVEPGFCEILWTFPPGYRSPRELKMNFPLVDDSYCPFWSPEKKERFDTDCFPRVAQTLEHLLDRFSGGNLLIVSHRAPIAGVFKKTVGRAQWVGLCTVSQIDRVGGKWKVVTSGDSAHLSDRTNLRAY